VAFKNANGKSRAVGHAAHGRFASISFRLDLIDHKPFFLLQVSIQHTMTISVQKKGDYVVKPLPSALLEDCTTYLEEQLYNQGFATLSSALLSGFSNSSPIHVPPPQHLALAATLAAHPSFTTRTSQSDKRRTAQAALTYLRHVQKHTTVLTAGLARAFVFGGSANSGRDQRAKLRRSAARHSEDTNEGQDQSQDNRQIHNPYAQEKSLFRNADDFWSVVGWSLNCSTKHPHRWSVWKAWLEVMLSILEDDMSRCKATVEGEAGFQDALILQYITGAGGRSINLRRIMRAIFADGSTQSLAEFPEIWRNETRLPKQDSNERSQKRKQLDIENDEFADYFDAGSDADSTGDPDSSNTLSNSLAEDLQGDQEAAIDSKKNASSGTASAKNTTWPDGADPTISLRLRLLAQLSALSFSAPTLSIEPYTLASLIAEFIRSLPIGTFTQYILPLTSPFSVDMQVTINEILLKSLVAGDTPMDASSAMTQDAFEKWYAPRSAGNASVVDNTKVSVLVESVLRNLWQADCLPVEGRVSLGKAVEKGIVAREGKVGSSRVKAGKKVESDCAARVMLQNSAGRLRTFLATLKKL
jgi:hypothetical protein